VKNWTTILAQTDVRDYNGEPLYAEALVRPRWYWFLRRVRLFLSIVWREADEGFRLPIALAWEVSKVAEGLSA
jgi:hypothetical protein